MSSYCLKCRKKIQKRVLKTNNGKTMLLSKQEASGILSS